MDMPSLYRLKIFTDHDAYRIVIDFEDRDEAAALKKALSDHIYSGQSFIYDFDYDDVEYTIRTDKIISMEIHDIA